MIKLCRTCEYFDRHYGDCHNRLSPRFQTQPDWTCRQWVEDSTMDAVDAEIERILAMTDEECMAAGIAEYGSEEAWRKAMADLRQRMLDAVDAHILAKRLRGDWNDR
jgi:hypothetical protein